MRIEWFVWERWQVCQFRDKKPLLSKGIVDHIMYITKWVHSEREMFHRQHVSQQWGSSDPFEKDDKFVNFVDGNNYCQKELLNNDIINENCFITNFYLNSEDQMIRVGKMTSLSTSWKEIILLKKNYIILVKRNCISMARCSHHWMSL